MTTKEFYHLTLKSIYHSMMSIHPCDNIIGNQLCSLESLKDYSQELLDFHPGWIINLQGNLPRKLLTGFTILHWTEEGWKANKSIIEKAFKTCFPNPTNLLQEWTNFEKIAVKHFSVIERTRKRRIKKLEIEIDYLKIVKL